MLGCVWLGLCRTQLGLQSWPFVKGVRERLDDGLGWTRNSSTPVTHKLEMAQECCLESVDLHHYTSY